MVRLICNNVIEMYYLGLSHVAICSRKVAIGGLVLPNFIEKKSILT